MHIAAFGDSLMWGQGLKRSDRFTARIASALPGVLGKQHAVAILAADASRSGAQINARKDDKIDQRKLFVDAYPSLFHGSNEWDRFLGAVVGGDAPATGLYGEIPAPFPTVLGQVEFVSEALGKAIDVALVDGGVNDIDVESIVKPTVDRGKWVEVWDTPLREVGFASVLELIGSVRKKCPNAIIMYFGFFAPLSYSSNTGKIRDAMQYELDNDLEWLINDIVGENATLHTKDVDSLIRECLNRSVWMQGRWQYWTRQAVVAANHSDLRGPGVLYVPSGFRFENSVFGTKPFLHEDYIDPTVDPARAERMKHCPRADHLKAIDSLHEAVTSQIANLIPGTGHAQPIAARTLQELDDAIDGPRQTKHSLQAYKAFLEGDSKLDLSALRNLLGVLEWQLRQEIGRIRHAQIASTSHPNAKGAKSYADIAIARLERHLADAKQIEVDERAKLPPKTDGVESIDAKLRRYRVRSSGALAGDVGHLDVDSLAVRIVTAANSDKNFAADVHLYVHTKTARGTGLEGYLLNFVYAPVRPGEPFPRPFSKPYPQFEPGATDHFTIDTMGQLRLDEIEACLLWVGENPLDSHDRRGGKLWRPDTVKLEVNGHEVATVSPAGKAFGFNSQLDFEYPAPYTGHDHGRIRDHRGLDEIDDPANDPAKDRDRRSEDVEIRDHGQVHDRGAGKSTSTITARRP